LGCGQVDADARVGADDQTQERRCRQDRRQGGLKWRIVGGWGQQHAHAPHALALLRACHKWPCSRTANKRDELAPPHRSPSIRSDKPYHISRAKTSLCTTAKWVGGCLHRVISSHYRTASVMSGAPR